MKRTVIAIFCAFLGVFSLPGTALAGDAATIHFKSGHVVIIDDGFKDIVEAMRGLNSSSSDHKIVKLDLQGGSFLLNVAEVVIVCRDSCRGLTTVDTRDAARGR